MHHHILCRAWELAYIYSTRSDRSSLDQWLSMRALVRGDGATFGGSYPSCNIFYIESLETKYLARRLNVGLIGTTFLMCLFGFPETKWHRMHPDEIPSIEIPNITQSPNRKADIDTKNTLNSVEKITLPEISKVLKQLPLSAIHISVREDQANNNSSYSRVTHIRSRASS